MAFRVEVTARAQADILEVFDWIREQAPAAAHAWYLGLFEKLSTLAVNPKRCSRAPESDIVDREIRQLYYGKRSHDWFRALFDIKDESVRVLRVRRCSQRELPPKDLSDDVDG